MEVEVKKMQKWRIRVGEKYVGEVRASRYEYDRAAATHVWFDKKGKVVAAIEKRVGGIVIEVESEPGAMNPGTR